MRLPASTRGARRREAGQFRHPSWDQKYYITSFLHYKRTDSK